MIMIQQNMAFLLLFMIKVTGLILLIVGIGVNSSKMNKEMSGENI